MKRKLSIFLVEDNSLDAMVFQRVLKKVDPAAEVVRAENGIEALEMIQSACSEKKPSKPYLTLLDINMPGMNGHELLEKLRDAPQDQTSMIFMFTTSSSPQDIAKAYEAGANGYIVKPDDTCSMELVLQTIEEFWNICEPPR